MAVVLRLILCPLKEGPTIDFEPYKASTMIDTEDSCTETYLKDLNCEYTLQVV